MLDDLWWLLPGPYSFVAEVADQVRSGRNVIIDGPRCFPAGFKAALRRHLPEDDGWNWSSIRLEETTPEASPIEILMEAFGDESTGRVAPPTLTDLMACTSVQGRLIWIEGFDMERWRLWRGFIAEYAHACHHESEGARSRLVCMLSLPCTAPRPAPDTCLNVLEWGDRVELPDLHLYASHRLRHAPVSGLERDLASAIVAQLALWDRLLAEDLISAFGHGLVDPMPHLEAHADRRGWRYPPRVGSDAWFEGQAYSQQGREVHHSAIPGMNELVRRRLWKAQVIVLFPALEEVRQLLLSRLSTFLRIPFHTMDGVRVSDPQGLELTHIEAQCSERPLHVEPEYLELVRAARQARNALAHLETVPLGLVHVLGQHVG